jgi:hypothetical protein
MARKRWRSVLYAAALLLSAGCIEQEQVFTINPDGRGKVRYDVRLPGDAAVGPSIGPVGKQKEKSLDQMLKEAVARQLTRGKVAAWKDVSGRWLPDGRLHFTGTAYFDRIEDLRGKDKNSNLDFEQFNVAVDKDGGLVLTLHRQEEKPGPDPTKMTDAELDEFVMRQRIKYQASKPFMVALFTDLRIKTKFNLPGEVGEIKGFNKAGARGATRDLDGNATLRAFHKFMAQDNATLKKLFKAGKTADLAESFGVPVLMGGARLTVPKTAGPLFDYDKEVKEARAAYPALRKQFGLGAKDKLPGK